MTRISVLILALLLLISGSAQAQPTVILSAEALDNYESILFTFDQPDLASMQGCHYNLFAAGHSKDLKTLPGEGLSIATFYRELSQIKIIAGPLPRLARKLGKKHFRVVSSVRVYFRVLLSCPAGTNGLGDIISLRIPTSKTGTRRSVKKLLFAMKFHMRYYEPV